MVKNGNDNTIPALLPSHFTGEMAALWRGSVLLVVISPPLSPANGGIRPLVAADAGGQTCFQVHGWGREWENRCPAPNRKPWQKGNFIMK